MIKATGISTKAHRNSGVTSYRFREESEIRQAVKESTESRNSRKPIHTGSRGIPLLNPSSEEISQCMLDQQRLYNKTAGLRVREEMLTISDDELPGDRKEETVAKIAERFSDYYFDKGFQVAYGVYPFGNGDRGKGYDILYSINAVSFRDGSKFVRNSDTYEEETNRAARTVVAEVTGNILPEEERFNMQSLEYYGV